MAEDKNPTTIPHLRSQGEFFMTGVIPVGPQSRNTPCTICTEQFTTDVVQLKGACGHFFHCICILEWLNGNERQNRTCPNCRRELYEATPDTSSATDEGPRGNDNDPAERNRAFFARLQDAQFDELTASNAQRREIVLAWRRARAVQQIEEEGIDSIRINRSYVDSEAEGEDEN